MTYSQRVFPAGMILNTGTSIRSDDPNLILWTVIMSVLCGVGFILPENKGGE